MYGKWESRVREAGGSDPLVPPPLPPSQPLSTEDCSIENAGNLLFVYAKTNQVK